jgi:hypothetical protein
MKNPRFRLKADCEHRKAGILNIESAANAAKALLIAFMSLTATAYLKA